MALVQGLPTSNFGERIIKQGSVFFSILKSRTLVYVFVLAALGTFFVDSGTKIPDIFTLVKLGASVYFLALATYLYNDLTDYDVDHVNNRRTVSSTRSYYSQIMYHTLGFFVISTLLAFSVNVPTGISSLGFLALAILYSNKRTHLKDKFVWKTVVTAAGGSIAALMGFFSSGTFSYLGLVSPLIAFMFWFTLGPLGDVSDIAGDKANGRRTFPIVLGVRNTFRLMHGVIFSLMGLILSLYYFDLINIVGLILSLGMCVAVSCVIVRVSKAYQEKRIVKQTRTILRYSLFLIQIMFIVGIAVTSTL